jgi:hypothetical protein
LFVYNAVSVAVNLQFSKLRNEATGLSYEQVYEATETLLISESQKSASIASEHLIQLTKCPVCKKKIREKHDLDIVSHVAVNYPTLKQLIS